MTESTAHIATSPDVNVSPVESRESRPATLREYLESLLITVVLALFGTTFVVQAFKIPSPSMEPTLLVGDHLLVNKFIFGGRDHWYERLLPYRDIRHGDIIVFKFPYHVHEHYVKRVIGLPGDRIKIVDQQVYVNGKRLVEPYIVRDRNAPYDPFGDNFPPRSSEYLQSNMQQEWADQILNNVVDGEVIVPRGKYFAMGDNRDHSWDSRYWGFVDRDAIMGRPVVIYWSVEEPADDEVDNNEPGGIGGFINTIIHLPSKTRWSRMLRQVH